MASRSDTVTKSRQKAREEGRRRLNAMLSTEGSELYDRMRGRFDSEREMVEAALSALERTDNGSGEPTPEQIIEWIRRRA